MSDLASFESSIPDSRETTEKPFPRPRLRKVCRAMSLPSPAGKFFRLEDFPQIGQTTWVAVVPKWNRVP